MRVNKYTYDAEVVYIEKESSKFVNWNGYRMATEYNGKLYFACAGYPTCLSLHNKNKWNH